LIGKACGKAYTLFRRRSASTYTIRDVYGIRAPAVRAFGLNQIVKSGS
jgi:hypothetical protein